MHYRCPTTLSRIGWDFLVLEDRITPSWFKKHILHPIERAVKDVVAEAKRIAPAVIQAAEVAVSILQPELAPLLIPAATVANDLVRGETSLGKLAGDAVKAYVGAQVGNVVGGFAASARTVISTSAGGVVGDVISAAPIQTAVQAAVAHDVVVGQTNPLELVKDVALAGGLAVAGSAVSGGIAGVQASLGNQLTAPLAQEVSGVVQTTVVADIQKGENDFGQVGHDVLHAIGQGAKGGAIAVAAAVAGGAVQNLLPDLAPPIPGSVAQTISSLPPSVDLRSIQSLPLPSMPEEAEAADPIVVDDPSPLLSAADGGTTAKRVTGMVAAPERIAPVIGSPPNEPLVELTPASESPIALGIADVPAAPSTFSSTPSMNSEVVGDTDDFSLHGVNVDTPTESVTPVTSPLLLGQSGEEATGFRAAASHFENRAAEAVMSFVSPVQEAYYASPIGAATNPDAHAAVVAGWKQKLEATYGNIKVITSDFTGLMGLNPDPEAQNAAANDVIGRLRQVPGNAAQIRDQMAPYIAEFRAGNYGAASGDFAADGLVFIAGGIANRAGQLAETAGLVKSVSAGAANTAKMAADAERYGGVRLLSQSLRDAGFDRERRLEVIQSFTNPTTGGIVARVADGGEGFLRYFGGNSKSRLYSEGSDFTPFEGKVSKPTGSYLTDSFPVAGSAHSTLALPGGAPSTELAQFGIIPNTVYFEGTAAAAFGKPGGGKQFYVINPSDLIRK